MGDSWDMILFLFTNRVWQTVVYWPFIPGRHGRLMGQDTIPLHRQSLADSGLLGIHPRQAWETHGTGYYFSSLKEPGRQWFTGHSSQAGMGDSIMGQDTISLHWESLADSCLLGIHPRQARETHGTWYYSSWLREPGRQWFTGHPSQAGMGDSIMGHDTIPLHWESLADSGLLGIHPRQAWETRSWDMILFFFTERAWQTNDLLGNHTRELWETHWDSGRQWFTGQSYQGAMGVSRDRVLFCHTEAKGKG